MKALKSNGKKAMFYPLNESNELQRIESELNRIHSERLTSPYQSTDQFYGENTVKAIKEFIEKDHVQYSNILYQFACDEEGFELKNI